MRTYYLTIELYGRKTTFKVEQSDELAEAEGHMRYQISTFNKRAEIFVNTAKAPLDRFDGPGLSPEDTFTKAEVDVITQAIRNYNESRQLNFDCVPCDF